MLDSDLDDSFLLEALEKVEQTQENFSTHSTLSDLKSSGATNSANTNTKEISCTSNSNIEKYNDNFRTNLLKTLNTHKTNVFNSKLENQNQSTNQSFLSIKRKIEDKEPKYLPEELRYPIQSQNKIGTFTDLRTQNTSDLKILEPKLKFVSSFNSPISSVIKKRKFPGPAGILPEWGQRNLRLNLTDNKTSHFDSDQVQESVCSQTSAEDFISGPWREMLMDLDPLTNSRNVLQSHNIRSTLRKNTLRSQTCIRKICFLVVMVRSIDLSHQDATAVFYDETGEIQGTVSESVLEKYGSHIFSGTVLVLKDATILSPGLFQPGMGVMGQLKKHYLTITTNSIMTIYSPHDDGQIRKVELLNLTKDGLEFLLSADEGTRERTELIENEENEQQQQQQQQHQQFSLYQNIGTENKNARGFQNQMNIPVYKSPVNNFYKNSFGVPKTGANFTKNISNNIKPTPNMVKPTTNSSSNYGLQKQICNFRNNEVYSKSISSETVEQSKLDLFNHKNKIAKNDSIKSAADTFGSFSDDEELDSLLASINTDTL